MPVGTFVVVVETEADEAIIRSILEALPARVLSLEEGAERRRPRPGGAKSPAQRSRVQE